MSFFLVVSLVLFAVHMYLWRRLVHEPALPKPARLWATAVILCLGLSIPASFMMRDPEQPALLLTGNIWLGLMFYMTTLLLIRDAVRLPTWLIARLRRIVGSRPVRPQTTASQTTASQTPVPQPPGQPPSAQNATAAVLAAAGNDAATAPLPIEPSAVQRREFIARSSAAAAVVATGGIGLWGTRAALWELDTPEVEVFLPRLPKALDGYQIALLSDIHIGATLHGRFLRDLVATTNALKPDLVAITGDLVDGSVETLGRHVAELRGLRARQGTVFVTGNHEYYSGADEWVVFLRQLGVRVLLNEHTVLGDSDPRGAQFDLGGVVDHHAFQYNGPEASAKAAVMGRDPERALVMLAHQPIQIEDVASAGAGLQLSGHTHGGQLFPFGAVAMLVQPYLAGLYRHNEDTQIYVSRGTGFWGPPMRVMAPAEITRIRLVSA